MEPLRLFALASHNASWLASRQAVLSENVANADTPGYRARDLRPFAEALALVGLDISRTDVNHLESSGAVQTGPNVRAGRAGNIVLSTNPVELDQELMKAGDVHRAYALNIGVVRAFHRMLISTAKA